MSNAAAAAAAVAVVGADDDDDDDDAIWICDLNFLSNKFGLASSGFQ